MDGQIAVEAPPSTTSEKDFPFPVVSICGDYWSKRNHTFGDSGSRRCRFYDYTPNDATDDDYYEIDECDSRLFPFENDENFKYGGVTGPCFKRVMADTEGNAIFDMAMNLDLSEAYEESRFCSVCGDENMPKQMLMVHGISGNLQHQAIWIYYCKTKQIGRKQLGQKT